MVPTWQPSIDYLETAVASILDQFDAGDPVQIELVDDCSPDFDVTAFANRFGSGRISAHRNERHRGLAGNWNTCIARSKHPWVHLLHQDDYVLDGFYEAILHGIAAAPDIAAAFSASWFADATGKRWSPRLVRMNQPGILTDWVQHIFVNLSIQCSAIVVRRKIYESMGGFDPALSHTLDWDMWKRIAVSHPIWFEPQPLACFRRHHESETSRQRA